MKKTFLALLIALTPLSGLAGNMAVDARTQGMAGAGTVAASFLASGFYNPALAALQPAKTYGVLFPVLGTQTRDSGDLFGGIDEVKNSFARLQGAPTDTALQDNTINALNSLSNKQARVSGGIGGAAGIKSDNISSVFFIKAYTDTLSFANVASTDIDNIGTNAASTLSSTAQVLGVGVVDLGLTLAKNVAIFEQTLAVGITPKVQQLYTHHYQANVLNFDFDDWTDGNSRIDKTALNLDVGIAWQQDNYRLGLMARNLVKHRIETVVNTYAFEYELKPLYTLGASWQNERLLLTTDIDLNQYDGFRAIDGPVMSDDTQLFRVGAEVFVIDEVRLRAGYMHDLKSSLDPTYTLGFGVGTDATAWLDVAFEVIDRHSVGGAIQLSFAM